MDDDELIAALAAGDDAALRELFARHAPWLAARLRAALPAPDVEDVLQETFLAVWKGASAYRPRGTARAWMWVIARNQAALLLRRRGPATLPLRDTWPLDESPQPGPDPADIATARADIAAALNGPEGDLLRLVYVEDRPVAEVAALLGVPAGTVKSRAHRARRLLRIALGGTR
ncbi:MAG TPA: RNA polymerase sigma factor [Trebonia sp.]|nr:RNA polymerase sigma factor [Trebonia sp.]